MACSRCGKKRPVTSPSVVSGGQTPRIVPSPTSVPKRDNRDAHAIITGLTYVPSK